MKMSQGSLILLGTACMLAVTGACGGREETSADLASSSQCVEIPDGYYLFADGKFSPTSSEIALEPEPAVNQRVVAQADQINHELASAGLDWLSVDIKGPVALLTGTAADDAAKVSGLEAARTIIRAERRPSDPEWIIVDDISVGESNGTPAAALASLSDQPTPEACQYALDRIMNGGRVEFASTNSEVAPQSEPMLDAVAAALALCGDYQVEIASHTDARGAESHNLNLSQERASAVRDYLVAKGAPGGSLTAKGYGETRPLDASQTAEAYARNRRTEFIVQGN